MKIPTVPRPDCSCGQPATHEVDVNVRRLDLTREAGVHSVPYWTPSFRSQTVHVSALVCATCVKNHVRISLDVSASVEKAKVKL